MLSEAKKILLVSSAFRRTKIVVVHHLYQFARDLWYRLQGEGQRENRGTHGRTLSVEKVEEHGAVDVIRLSECGRAFPFVHCGGYLKADASAADPSHEHQGVC